MKKRIWAALFALALCLSAASAQGDVPVPEAGEPVFSNLNGVEVLDATMELLRQGGVDAQSVDVLSAWVLDYNVLCQNNPVYRLAGEYAPMPEGAVDYGEEVDVYAAFAQQWWEGAQREYPDLTARVIAYWLLRDAISIANPLASQDWDSEGWLSSDADCIAGNPNLRLDEAQTAACFTLFHPVDVVQGADAGEMYEAIAQAWQERGICFAEGEAALVTVWIPDAAQCAPTHAAVLVPAQGAFLLFEKYGALYPYQATLFASRDEVRDYFENWLRLAYRGFEQPAPALVLVNDQML